MEVIFSIFSIFIFQSNMRSCHQLHILIMNRYFIIYRAVNFFNNEIGCSLYSFIRIFAAGYLLVYFINFLQFGEFFLAVISPNRSIFYTFLNFLSVQRILFGSHLSKPKHFSIFFLYSLQFEEFISQADSPNGNIFYAFLIFPSVRRIPFQAGSPKCTFLIVFLR